MTPVWHLPHVHPNKCFTTHDPCIHLYICKAFCCNFCFIRAPGMLHISFPIGITKTDTHPHHPNPISLHSASVTLTLQRTGKLNWACPLQMQPVDGAKWRRGGGGERGGETAAERESHGAGMLQLWQPKRFAWEHLSLTAQMGCRRGIGTTGAWGWCRHTEDMW